MPFNDDDPAEIAERAAKGFEYAGLLYLMAATTAAELDQEILHRLALAQTMSSFARAESIRANAAVTEVSAQQLAKAIVDALREYDNGRGEPDDW